MEIVELNAACGGRSGNLNGCEGSVCGTAGEEP